MIYQVILRHLITYSPVYSLICTLVLATATIVYVVLAYKILKNSEQSRVRPNVIADMGIRDNWFYILTKNTGPGLAKDISIKIDPPVNLGDIIINDLNIASLAPEQEFREQYAIISNTTYLNLTKLNRTISIQYQDQFSNSFASQRMFDVRLFDNEADIFSNPYKGIEKRLGEIVKALKITKNDEHFNEITNQLKSIKSAIEEIKTN